MTTRRDGLDDPRHLQDGIDREDRENDPKQPLDPGRAGDEGHEEDRGDQGEQEFHAAPRAGGFEKVARTSEVPSFSSIRALSVRREDPRNSPYGISERSVSFWVMSRALWPPLMKDHSQLIATVSRLRVPIRK